MFIKGEHERQLAYSAHTACDENNFILATVVTAANVNDSRVFDEVFDEVTDQFPEVDTVTVDAGCKTLAIAKKIIDSGRIPCMPYKRPNGGEDFFSPNKYIYDKYYDCILCPNDQVLRYSTTNRNGYREYKSDPGVCRSCPYLSRCTHSKSCQKVVTRHIWAEYMETVEDIRLSPHGKETCKKRSQTIERVFADAKERHAMRYTYYRGIRKVSAWVKLKFAAMNLKKMAFKDVVFFAATPISGVEKPQLSEIREVAWQPLEFALAKIRFLNDRRVLDDAVKYIVANKLK